MTIDNGLDLIDLMGPAATREDYLALADAAQAIADDPEMWADDDGPTETVFDDPADPVNLVQELRSANEGTNHPSEA